jgi:hypothetical protein
MNTKATGEGRGRHCWLNRAEVLSEKDGKRLT